MASARGEVVDIIEPPKKRSRKGIKLHRISNETRLLFIEDALADGVTKACAKYGVPTSTGYDLMKQWDPTMGAKSLERERPGPEHGHPRKMTHEVRDFIKTRIDESNTLSGLQIAREVCEKFDIRVSKSTVNKFLAKEDITTKTATTEDVQRNTDVLIAERFRFAQLMLEEGGRPEDPSALIYWDITYFENCIVGRRARSRRGTPAVVPKGHRGVYIPTDESVKKRKSKKRRQPSAEIMDITFTTDKPDTYKGGKVNSVAVFAAMTGSEILMARSQLRHYTGDDAYCFFKELLQKLEVNYPKKPFTFIGDNEGIYEKAMSLFKEPQYHRHTVIPNPRYSPFLNAIEYLFNQLKANVRGQQYKTLREVIAATQRSFEWVQPAHLLNYHKTVQAYLLQCLRREPIHAWKKKLGEDKADTTEITKQRWDVKHRTVFATEKEALNKPMVKDNITNPPKASNAVMIKDGQEVAIYPRN